MIKEIQKDKTIWINITNPSNKDIALLKQRFAINLPVLSELTPPIKRSKLEEYKDYLFLVIHFPLFNRKKRANESAELDMIIFKNILITSHTVQFPELKQLFDRCVSDDKLKNRYMENSAVCLAFRILDLLIDSRLPMLDHIDDNINNIDEGIFEGNERKMVSEIAIIKHDIISFRRIIKPQRVVLENLAHAYSKITYENLSRLASEVIGSNIKVWNTLENHKEMIEALEHTNESLLSYKLNDTMKILTAFSVIILPLSLMVNMFGMNITNGMPFVESPVGFWIIFFMMMIASMLLIVFFRYKKWL
ncbi:MAG: magnesium transporter CorA family protein [Candidatus Paceibacterota bacterium]|jgi:magnesium transporter